MTPLYNLKKLQEMSGDNPLFIEKMVKLFLDTIPEILGSLKDGFENGDFQKVYKAAHKAKPSLDLMGIETLHEAIRELEQNALKEIHIDKIPFQIEQIVETLEQVKHQLASR